MRSHVTVSRSAFSQSGAHELQLGVASYSTTVPSKHVRASSEAIIWNFATVPVHEAKIPIQPKLEIGAVDDPLEREADRVAEEIMDTPGPGAAKEAGVSGQLPIPQIQRICTECKEEKERGPIPIMAKGLYGQSCESAPSEDREKETETEEDTRLMAKACCGELHRTNEHFEEQLSRTRGEGSTLSGKTQTLMESKFGYDFGGVRIHADAHAVEMTKALSAEAFTSGKHIYFNAGRYNAETPAGQRLLGHELTHVIQQHARGNPGPSTIRSGEAGKPLIQRYSLRGFPPTEKAAMHAAIPAAISKVKACPKLSWWGKWVISSAIATKRYDYKEDLGLCGWTFPVSWYIEIGKDAFNTSKCCDLSSTIAHEASHTEFYTEGRAQKMECNCFGCSC